MIRAISVAATILASSAPGAAESERQLGPHQHGHGSLNLAVEGQTVQMELEVPGVDIVGFEYEAKTAEDRAKMEAAEKKLAQPLALFVLPGKAGCKVTSAKVSIARESETDHDAHEHEDHAHRPKPTEHEAEHSEFHAEYALSCSNVAAITTISFPYFDAFPNSAELAVTLITEKSQESLRGESRARPHRYSGHNVGAPVVLKSRPKAARSSTHALRVDKVDFRWPGAHAFEIAIDRLAIESGERILLLGPSGSGKSTLLSLVCGIAVPQAGVIEVLGRNLAAMSAMDRDRFRAEHYGVIFQMFNLLPYASALDNVLLGLSFAPERQKRVVELSSGQGRSGATSCSPWRPRAVGHRGNCREVERRPAAARGRGPRANRCTGARNCRRTDFGIGQKNAGDLSRFAI